MRLSNGKRIKWEPAALMIVVLGLGLWIAFGPTSRPQFALRPDAVTQDIRINEHRGVLEAAPDGQGGFTFRVLMRGQPPSAVYTRTEIERFLSPAVVADAVAPRSNWVFRKLNITSWVGVVWLTIGLIGQVLFSGRMVLQWIASERRRRSIITESFWWFSLGGSLLLFSYFVWRQEPVGMLGQASGIVVYARNLRLIYKHKRRLQRSEIEEEEEVAV
jgi:lipid-A-disaccharide synthase-like uncharacterized protein